MKRINPPFFRQSFLVLVLGMTILSLSGCSSIGNMFSSWPFGSDTQDEVFEQAEVLAKTGMDEFNLGNYSEALRAFEEILDRYPFSPQAMLAELKSADCHYYRNEFVEAKTLYKEFEERHPTNEAIPYVMFQIGMCDFSRSDRIDRDISGAQDAIQSFSRLLRTYPDSPYSREARARIQAAKEFLVNHEYFVAVFYVRTKQFKQAKHRLKYILAMYPNSSVTPKAKSLLARLDAGDPPRWGLSKWLPDIQMPDWIYFDPSDKDIRPEDTPAEIPAIPKAPEKE
jgi:outer membrane protein assembly factor BamD